MKTTSKYNPWIQDSSFAIIQVSGNTHRHSLGASAAMIKHYDHKQLEEERVYSVSHSYTSKHISEGCSGQELKQRKNLVVETETEVIEKLFLLSCSSWLFQSSFSYTLASVD